ncbi:TetR/AcrR family transcriptional regulator [Brucella pseudogrignonensis]|uniref:TetR/AcrR family transcriptional regulator n=1 Tax=Brucella pseudogrignonensis TaxID=419475 RepID=UPI000CFB8781|nr:TetR/AcrR family transcriptional regulator [Brucella pseudogrignonensis]MQP41712.1 TetR family transcriptional regulator [Ochrobactrum sp. MYb237]PQZ42788.1 TetR family transcriptional regulator [Brucella pseudogrignonensis]PRA37940.1 TetR family transcriptional regulator [Brucella pseudogrignonensis]PRA63751.1 TetR family transcriptional regulator [Brucella pseudogrignonensis]
MSIANRRQKNPQLVRSQLIESAVELALESGLNAVSLEAVASRAGVTKGGLLHHFANKQLLIDAVFDELVLDFETALRARMANDQEIRGRFTRVYLELAIEAQQDDSRVWALWISVFSDARLRDAWGHWLNARLEEYGDTESGADMEAVRFAADGIWLSHMVGVVPNDWSALRSRLLKMISD